MSKYIALRSESARVMILGIGQAYLRCTSVNILSNPFTDHDNMLTCCHNRFTDRDNMLTC
jgi:hypothetical protein